MPHSTLKMRPQPLSSEVAKCPGGQTFDYESDRDWEMKFRIHGKVCARLVEGSKQVRRSRKALMLREQQHDTVERRRGEFMTTIRG